MNGSSHECLPGTRCDDWEPCRRYCGNAWPESVEPFVRDLTPCAARVDAIGTQETDLQSLSDEELRSRSFALLAAVNDKE